MEKQYDPANENIVEVTAEQETPMAAQVEMAKKQRPVTRRYNRRGARRGKYAYAAPLGVLISLLCVVGIVALIFTGVNAIRRATDTTELEEEMYYYLEPVLVYTPTAFDLEEAPETEQDAFLNAAAYQVMLAEQIRMLRESDESCRYAVDDNGRIAVPVTEIETAYDTLFGTKAVLTHRSLEESGLEYSESDQYYYVPFEVANTGYRPVVDYVKRRSGSYEVRIGFVANTDVRLDEHGNELQPTADMASHYQTYTLARKDDSYHIIACKDE